MKTKTWVIAISVFLMAALPFAGMAQSRKPSHPKPKNNKLQEIQALKGKITEWTYNDDFIYNGFYLESDKETYYVKFPPHLGKEIRNLKGNITVNGVINTPRNGKKEVKMVNIKSNGTTISDVKPKTFAQPGNDEATSGNGKVSQFKFNRKGEVSGYLIGNKTLLRIPPHKARQLNTMIQVGTKIEYTGIEKTLKEGEVAADNYKIIYVQTISVNGVQYLVK